jgi:predicted dehydrogenase/type 1 glutamine amidotransferase
MNDRISVLVLLAGRRHDYLHMARPLLKALEATHNFNLKVTTDAADLHLQDGDVLLAASDHPLQPGQAARLKDFVQGGGGLVLLHGTLAAWNDSGDMRELAGWAPSGPGPLTELVIRPDPSHPISARLGAEIKLTDELYFSEGPPVGASTLLRASWRFTEQVVAYERGVGEGCFVHLGLGHQQSTFEHDGFQKLVQRSVMFAAGRTATPSVGVGLIGYGAIARAHAESINAAAGLNVTAVCDVSDERRQAAATDLSVRTHTRLEDLLDDPDVGLVIVGTPPSIHADAVVAALDAGKHVVCEKPFAIHVADVDRMIDTATARDQVLTVYQSRRWDPDYLALREVVRSGRIGDAFYMESFIGGYSHPCDYWHSHEPISGGTIYDWGSHYFDWILQLIPDSVRTISANAHKRVWHDVTNADQVRVDLTFAGGAQASFLQSDIAAAAKPKWYVLGTRGSVVGEWKAQAVPADFPASVKIFTPADGGSHEELLHLSPRDDHGFYRNLADHLAWGEPLAVTPHEARRTVAVMEAATQSIARSGAQLEVDI